MIYDNIIDLVYFIGLIIKCESMHTTPILQVLYAALARDVSTKVDVAWVWDI